MLYNVVTNYHNNNITPNTTISSLQTQLTHLPPPRIPTLAVSRVFVCGATGTQGSALAHHLRENDVQVHALARDPSSDKAKALELIGVKLWAGNYDKEALTNATEGCEVIFINLMPDFQDLTAESRWSSNIIDAGKAAGAKQLVYSSGFRVDETDRLKFLNTQGLFATVLRPSAAIESQVKSAGYEKWTILRPGNFMANLLQPLARMYPGLVEQGVRTSALLPETVLPMMDMKTIGRFGGAAILNSELFNGKTVSYADELLNATQLLGLLSQATGRELKAVFLTDDEIQVQKGANPLIEG